MGKPAGTIQERVQVVGPEHFGVVSVDCAKRRSNWMLCDFYGKVIIEPTTVEHNAGALKAMILAAMNGKPMEAKPFSKPGASRRPTQKSCRGNKHP